MTREDIQELKLSKEYRDAFDTALAIHRKEHEPAATHFRNCVECKSGFALLLVAALRALKQHPCGECGGTGILANDGPFSRCGDCDGTGKQWH